MKSRFFLWVLMLVLMACGPSKEEEARQRHIEDSLMEIERNKAVDQANLILSADTATKPDSVSTAKK